VEPELVNVWDYERAAEEKLGPGPFGYFAGGANDELTLADNVAAYRRWNLRPRVLIDVAGTTTASTVLGQEVAMPILVAPVAFQRAAHPVGEVGMARATAAAGTVMCVSTMATATWAELAATEAPRWFQLYVPRDRKLANEVAAGAAEAGFSALVLTVDTPVLGRRERDLRTGFTIDHLLGLEWIREAQLTPRSAFESMSRSVTWDDVERFASVSGLPVVLKGIVTAEDARLACENGAAAVVVSNHGGRQLDGVAATLDVLPEVADAVEGRIEVLVDGGVRRGSDVVKALAFGARAVMVGRPALWGLTVGGEQGATRVLELLRDELQLALQLIGCLSPAEVTRAHVSRRDVTGDSP
jgi:isopentenyl diphosphate isomerase/L-lactate dehydrogenase-like FMN-dependent dehydrogenase